MQTDSQLQRDAMDKLILDPSIDHAQIGVTAKGGLVKKLCNAARD